MNVLTEVLQHRAIFSANDTGAALTAGANSENLELESIGHGVRNMDGDHVTVNGKIFSSRAYAFSSCVWFQRHAVDARRSC